MEENKEKVQILNCQNVIFYIILKDSFEEAKFEYFTRRIQRGERMKLLDVYGWCNVQQISYLTKFVFLKEYSVKKNLKNLLQYLKIQWTNRRHLQIEG